ncbi:unnamed protein product [Rhizophagus irregularis]|nr:unnamed protein product [Rhizophagus irregularis]
MGIGLDDCDESILSNKDEHAKQQGFQIIKDRLIELLQEFTEVGKSDSEELNEINQEDEINDKLILTLWYQMSRKSEKKCDKR